MIVKIFIWIQTLFLVISNAKNKYIQFYENKCKLIFNNHMIYGAVIFFIPSLFILTYKDINFLYLALVKTFNKNKKKNNFT